MKKIIFLLVIITCILNINAQINPMISFVTIKKIAAVKAEPRFKGEFLTSIPKGDTIIVNIAAKREFYYKIIYSNNDQKTPKSGYVYTEDLLEAISLEDARKFNTARKNYRRKGIYTISNVMTPGDELIIYRRNMNAGYLCYGFGFILGGLTFTTDDPNIIRGLAIGAGASALIGLIFQIEATQHVGKAGLLLNERGIGLSIPLK